MSSRLRTWLVAAIPVTVGVTFAIASVREGFVSVPVAVGCFLLMTAFVCGQAWNRQLARKHYPDRPSLVLWIDMAWLMALAWLVLWILAQYRLHTLPALR